MSRKDCSGQRKGGTDLTVTDELDDLALRDVGAFIEHTGDHATRPLGVDDPCLQDLFHRRKNRGSREQFHFDLYSGSEHLAAFDAGPRKLSMPTKYQPFCPIS